MGRKEDQDQGHHFRPDDDSLLPPPPYTATATASQHINNDDFSQTPSYFTSTTSLAPDPRSSSTQSLLPSPSSSTSTSTSTRRTLLLIYVHGFMGDETSFAQFPAHVHHEVTERLKCRDSPDEMVVHTKIYPRYKTRRKVEEGVARFNEWLAPHEGPLTDIILLGHSLGGILSAEVVLGSAQPRRIIGTINFDTPFLGMHPGVITSGIGSFFRSNPEETSESLRRDGMTAHGIPATTESTASSSSSYPANDPRWAKDPTYNPNFPNDKPLPQRSGLNAALYFINKHSDGLTRAAKSYVTSHLEFGGCLADYNGLHRRYANIVRLDDGVRGRVRVRFVNYYTASTGRPKQAIKSEPQVHSDMPKSDQAGPSSQTEDDAATQDLSELQISSTGKDSVDGTSNLSLSEPPSRDLRNEPDRSLPSEDPLPPLPTLPPIPDPLSCTSTDKAILKIARKDHDRQMKAYERAVKDYSKASKDRAKFLAKRQQRLSKDSSILAQQSGFGPGTGNTSVSTSASAKVNEIDPSTAPPAPISKYPRDRRFCLLPDKIHGEVDARWIRVFMPGLDEVGAHCSLFVSVGSEGAEGVSVGGSHSTSKGSTTSESTGDGQGGRYRWFVNDVVSRIIQWV